MGKFFKGSVYLTLKPTSSTHFDSVVVEAENPPKPRKNVNKSETWLDNKGLCIESPKKKKCPMIFPTKTPIFYNGGVSGSYNEF